MINPRLRRRRLLHNRRLLNRLLLLLLLLRLRLRLLRLRLRVLVLVLNRLLLLDFLLYHRSHRNELLPRKARDRQNPH